jgi:threonine synthase
MSHAIKEIARHEGMLIAPEGAALWQAYKKLKASISGLHPGEQVLLINTGSGYKYLENILFSE